jgi:hypothetical protein
MPFELLLDLDENFKVYTIIHFDVLKMNPLSNVQKRSIFYSKIVIFYIHFVTNFYSILNYVFGFYCSKYTQLKKFGARN